MCTYEVDRCNYRPGHDQRFNFSRTCPGGSPDSTSTHSSSDVSRSCTAVNSECWLFFKKKTHTQLRLPAPARTLWIYPFLSCSASFAKRPTRTGQRRCFAQSRNEINTTLLLRIANTNARGQTGIASFQGRPNLRSLPRRPGMHFTCFGLCLFNCLRAWQRELMWRSTTHSSGYKRFGIFRVQQVSTYVKTLKILPIRTLVPLS